MTGIQEDFTLRVEQVKGLLANVQLDVNKSESQLRHHVNILNKLDAVT